MPQGKPRPVLVMVLTSPPPPHQTSSTAKSKAGEPAIDLELEMLCHRLLQVVYLDTTVSNRHCTGASPCMYKPALPSFNRPYAIDVRVSVFSIRLRVMSGKKMVRSMVIAEMCAAAQLSLCRLLEADKTPFFFVLPY